VNSRAFASQAREFRRRREGRGAISASVRSALSPEEALDLEIRWTRGVRLVTVLFERHCADRPTTRRSLLALRWRSCTPQIKALRASSQALTARARELWIRATVCVTKSC